MSLELSVLCRATVACWESASESALYGQKVIYLWWFLVCWLSSPCRLLSPHLPCPLLPQPCGLAPWAGCAGAGSRAALLGASSGNGAGGEKEKGEGFSRPCQILAGYGCWERQGRGGVEGNGNCWSQCAALALSGKMMV